MAREPLVLSDAERRMVEGTWPMELITDDARQPLAVSTATDFAMRVLLSDHLEDVVVFRGGGDALGLPTSACLPDWLLESIAAGDADGSSGASVLRFLRHAVEKHPEAAKTHKATVEFMNADGVQKEAKPKRRERSPVRRRPRSDASGSRSRPWRRGRTCGGRRRWPGRSVRANLLNKVVFLDGCLRPDIPDPTSGATLRPGALLRAP